MCLFLNQIIFTLPFFIRGDDLLKKISSKRAAPVALAEEDGPSKKAKEGEESGGGNLEVMPRIQVHKVETVEACQHEVC
jgi:hypothetical protein